MKRNNIAQLISKQQSSAGFTLIELLVASIIGVIIIGAAGFGLSQVLKASKDGNAAADRRAEVARAYDFISDEIRKAELVEPNLQQVTPPNATPTNDPNFTQTGTVVLSLKIPEIDDSVDDPNPLNNLDSDNDDSNEARVVYYVSTPPPNSVWKGPRILYRWGPPFNASGNYAPRTNANNPNWVAQPLIDEISGTNITLSCETGWEDSVAAGFGACISPNSKSAQLYIEGDIKKALGQTDSYKSNTKTFARSNQATSINDYGINKPFSVLGYEFDGNGTALGDTPVSTQIEVYPEDDASTTNVDESLTAKTNEILTEGASTKTPIYGEEKIKITAIPENNCSSASSCSSVSVIFKINKNASGVTNAGKISPDSGTYNKDNGTLSDYPQVKMYVNGSVVPNDTSKVYTDTTNTQKTPYQFLKDKGVQFTEDTSTNPPTYKIKMNPNQVLLAFEIGQTDSTIPDGNGGTKPNPGYDHQDNLVILTSSDLNYPDP